MDLFESNFETHFPTQIEVVSSSPSTELVKLALFYTKMPVVVAEEGNKRAGGPSKSELRQVVLDIKSWFERQDPNFKCGSPMTDVDFQRMGKAVDAQFPAALDTLLSEVNGGLWLEDKKTMTSDEIIAAVQSNESSKRPGWKASHIPFACDDVPSIYLIVDTATERGEVYEYDIDDGMEEDSPVVAPALDAFLETYRDGLLNGMFEYIEDCGVTEKMGASRK